MARKVKVDPPERTYTAENLGEAGPVEEVQAPTVLEADDENYALQYGGIQLGEERRDPLKVVAAVVWQRLDASDFECAEHGEAREVRNWIRPGK
jgi:hypothetical protein